MNLYVFHRPSDGFNALIYGYALDIGEAEPFPWHTININSNRRWKLLCFRCVINNTDIDTYLKEFDSKEKYVIEEKQIDLPGWALRPAIYVLGRDDHGKGIKSLTDRVCRGKIYYALDKTAFLERLFPPDNMEREKVKEDILRLEAGVLKDIGIKLFSSDSDRFGNIEIYDSLDSSSLLEPIGLHVGMIKETRTSMNRPWSQQPISQGVTIWADETFEVNLPVWVNISLFNGRNNSVNTIADELKQIQRVGEEIKCKAEEPVSSLKIKVWSEHGELLHCSHSYLVRSININMALQSGKKIIKDPWSEKLPKKYQAKVENVESLSRESINIGGYSFDPWVPEGEAFQRTLKSLFSSPSQDRFFDATQEGEVLFFEYLQSLFDRNEVRKATFIDPFFGEEATVRLLPRLKNPSLSVEVITSLVNKKNEGDTETPLEKMQKTLLQNKTLLPSNFKVINVQNNNASEQQFHDRFLLLETSNGTEGWILGNSYHSQSQKYPAIMIKLQEDIITEIVQYFSDLLIGKAEKKEARSNVLYESKGIEITDGTKCEPLPGGLEYFPNWEYIIGFFPNQGSDSQEVLRQLIDNGFLENRQGFSTWRVTEDKLDEVTIKIKDYIHKLLAEEHYADKISDCFKCLAHWTYHGAGFHVQDIIVSDDRITTILTEILDALSEEIKSSLNKQEKQWSQIKTVFEQFKDEIESYEQCWALYEHSYEFDYLLKYNRFYAEYLWYVDREVYYETLDKNFILLPHWLYVLHRRKNFGAYHLSEIATRFLVFSELQSYFNQDVNSTWLSMPVSNIIKLKNLFTYLSIVREEKQRKLITYAIPLLEKDEIEYNDILPYLQNLRINALISLTEALEPTKHELADMVRESIIDRWTSKLKKEELFFHYTQDRPETEMLVDISTRLYESDWPNWYTQQFLNEFQWDKYKNPFQRFHQYSLWHSNSIRLLWSLYVGLTYLETQIQKVDTCNKTEVLTKILKEIINRFEQYLVPSVWHLPFRDVLLDDVLYLIGLLVDKLEMKEEMPKLLSIIDSPQVQLTRKLNVYLSSYQLFINQEEKVLSILSSPTLLPWLKESSMTKIRWMAGVFKDFSNQAQYDNQELVHSIQNLLLTLLNNASENPIDILWRLGLSDPMKHPSQWVNWANVLKVNDYQLQGIWQDPKGFDFFGKLLALGIYLLGDLESFQTWLHQDIYGEGTSPWCRILKKQKDEVLEELFRELVGIPS